MLQRLLLLGLGLLSVLVKFERSSLVVTVEEGFHLIRAIVGIVYEIYSTTLPQNYGLIFLNINLTYTYQCLQKQDCQGFDNDPALVYSLMYFSTCTCITFL